MIIQPLHCGLFEKQGGPPLKWRGRYWGQLPVCPFKRSSKHGGWQLYFRKGGRKLAGFVNRKFLTLSVVFLLSVLCLLALFRHRSPAQHPQSAAPDLAPVTCPVTKPSAKPFKPSPPHGGPANGSKGRSFFYGSDQLWVGLQRDGVWKKLRLNYVSTPPVYSHGVIWGRKGYDPHTEPHPNLRITGRRLDAQAPPLVAHPAEGAVARVTDGRPKVGPSFMVVLLDLPTLGCWEINGQYEGGRL